MEQTLQKVVEEYSWLLVSGVALLLFQNTIREAVDGIMVFLGNDYNEDDVVEVDNLMTTAKDKAKDLATMGHPSYSMTKELFIAEPMAKINEAIKEHQKES